jgi:hypothetical protein
MDQPQVQGWASLELHKHKYYSLQELANIELRNRSHGKTNLELETIIEGRMQIHVPQLKSTIVKFSGEQTSMKTCNVITWNSFATLKACSIWDQVILRSLQCSCRGCPQPQD